MPTTIGHQSERRSGLGSEERDEHVIAALSTLRDLRARIASHDCEGDFTRHRQLRGILKWRRRRHFEFVAACDGARNGFASISKKDHTPIKEVGSTPTSECLQAWPAQLLSIKSSSHASQSERARSRYITTPSKSHPMCASAKTSHSQVSADVSDFDSGARVAALRFSCMLKRCAFTLFL